MYTLLGKDFPYRNAEDLAFIFISRLSEQEFNEMLIHYRGKVEKEEKDLHACCRILLTAIHATGESREIRNIANFWTERMCALSEAQIAPLAAYLTSHRDELKTHITKEIIKGTR